MIGGTFLGYPDLYSWLHDWLPIIFMGLLCSRSWTRRCCDPGASIARSLSPRPTSAAASAFSQCIPATSRSRMTSALERVVAGMQSRRALTDHEKRVVAYHEAGHALCGELLPSVDRVHRISIVPRGRALGYTLNLPEEDRYLKTREELIDFMTMLLGGRAAASAFSMVHEYAMGTGSTALPK